MAFLKACLAKVIPQSETVQFLLVGLDKAGKTTLLYRLKVPGWNSREMMGDMAEMRKKDETGKVQDAGYHYEEFNRLFDYGIWDCPGTPAMRSLWPSFYRTIKFGAVVFVIDATDEDEVRVQTAKQYLHFLMNEDELRDAAFAVVINSKESVARRMSKPVYDEKERDELNYKLGLHQLHPSCQSRVKKFVIDCIGVRGEADKDWTSVLEHVKKVRDKMPKG